MSSHGVSSSVGICFTVDISGAPSWILAVSAPHIPSHRMSGSGRNDLECRLNNLKTGPSALALRTWALAVPNIRAIRPVDATTKAASELIDFLPVVRAGLARVPNHYLPVRINESHFRCAFCHGFFSSDPTNLHVIVLSLEHFHRLNPSGGSMERREEGQGSLENLTTKVLL
jgi:hypothetical protein